jgi:hypothetical protein
MLMPTREVLPEFLTDYTHLTSQLKKRFLKVVRALVEDLREGRPPRLGLRTKAVESYPGIWELTWAPDGRATFHYGEPVLAGEANIVWRRIGSHAILDHP